MCCQVLFCRIKEDNNFQQYINIEECINRKVLMSLIAKLLECICSLVMFSSKVFQKFVKYELFKRRFIDTFFLVSGNRIIKSLLSAKQYLPQKRAG